VLPVLIEALQGRDQGLGSFCYTFTHPAIELLVKMGRPATPAVPYLIDALFGCSETRELAARALGSIGPDAKAAVPALTARLGDRYADARKAVAEALKRIDPEAAAKAGVQ
jgi:HEAT repeat protein